MGTKFKLQKTNNSYRFGSGKQKALGSIQVKIPIEGYRFIYEEVDVVQPDVPFFIGLDFLDLSLIHI